MLKNKSLLLSLFIVGIASLITRETLAETSRHFSANKPGLYCVEAANQFEVQVATDGREYSSAQLINANGSKIALFARTISAMTYPRYPIEIVQLFTNDSLTKPLSLNLVKSYDCVQAESGKVYPLRALIMKAESSESPLLPIFAGRNLCCQKLTR